MDIERAIERKKAEIELLKRDLEVLEAARKLLAADQAVDDRPREYIDLPSHKVRPGRIRHKVTRPGIPTLVEAMLREAKQPLHVDTILKLANGKGIRLIKTSVISTLSRLSGKKKTFNRPAPNTYGLIAWEDKP
jgi:hypothetical protein